MTRAASTIHAGAMVEKSLRRALYECGAKTPLSPSVSERGHKMREVRLIETIDRTRSRETAAPGSDPRQ